MSEPFVTRGFIGKRRGGTEKADRIPPGQYLTDDFPVLSAGPTPRIGLKLGRTETAVGAKASDLGVSLRPTNQSPYNKQR